jgi:hypothetical protein
MESTIKKWLSFSITGIATFGSWKRLYENEIVKKHNQGIYGLCKQEPNEDEIVYAVFKHGEDLEDLIDKKLAKESFLIDKLYAGNSVIYKLDKSYWLSKDDWNQLRKSDYSNIVKEDPHEGDLLYNIKYNTETLRRVMSDYLKCELDEGKIYWKIFQTEEETLDLSIINDLTMMQYEKQDLLRQMRKDPYNKDAYQWVLENSVEVADVVDIREDDPINVKDLGAMFGRLQSYLESIEGYNQVQLVFSGKKYPLMPNKVDFVNKMKTFVKKYNPQDLKKIERCIKRHLDPENRTMQLKYYIMKNNESALMTDYDNEDNTQSTNRVTMDI